jgi:hypothetical protein
VNLTRTPDHGAEPSTQRRLPTIARATAVTGGPGFLLGVLLHPPRDGAAIAAAGQLYGITHGLQAISLLLLAISLASVYALDADRYGRGGVLAFLTAITGTLCWFGLIVLDGTRKPVTAKYAAELVHTPADLDAGAAIISLPALLLFPIGYLLLARHGARRLGLLVGVGAVVYWSGSIPLLAVGPHSPLTQVLRSPGQCPSRRQSPRDARFGRLAATGSLPSDLRLPLGGWNHRLLAARHIRDKA